MVWYENEKKYSKQELKKVGKDTTEISILLVILGLILSFLSIYDLRFYPVLLFNLTGIIVYNFFLMRLKKEYYERVCK